MQKRGTMVEWLDTLSYDAEGSRFESEASWCLNKTVSSMVTLFEQGKGNVGKGKELAPPFICCAQDTVGL